jgi:prepilin signal peptidase PulO-like enzyme (type II secretory pathway)
VPTLLIVFFVLGAVLASFGGVVAGRMGTGQSWLRGRSRCDACGKDLSLVSLIPVISSLLRDACHSCGTRVSALYALQEILLGALFVAGALHFGLTLGLIAFYAFLFVLYVLVLYDIRHTIVPPMLSSLLIALGLLCAVLFAPSLDALVTALLVAAGICIAFLALHFFSGGRAMGLGDAPVSFALSLVAAPLAFAGLVFSFWIGAVVGIALVLMQRGRRMNSEVPFVPFLAAGYLLAIFTQWNPFPF